MPKSPLAITLTVVALFFGGGAVGAGAGGWLGGVNWAAVVGAFALPVAFGLAMTAWYGVGILWMLWLLARLVLSSAETRRAMLNRPAAEVLNPSGDPHWTVPGTWLFAPLCAGVAGVFGAAIGFGQSASLPGSIGAMAALGLGYGVVMRRAARAGYLIPPEYLD